MFSPNTGKYGLEKSPYLDIFCAVRMQSIDSVETYAYGTRKDLASKKEETKCKNIKKRHKFTLIILQKKT